MLSLHAPVSIAAKIVCFTMPPPFFQNAEPRRRAAEIKRAVNAAFTTLRECCIGPNCGERRLDLWLSNRRLLRKRICQPGRNCGAWLATVSHELSIWHSDSGDPPFLFSLLQRPEPAIPIVNATIFPESTIIRHARGGETAHQPIKAFRKDNSLCSGSRIDSNELSDLTEPVVHAGINPAELLERSRGLEHDAAPSQKRSGFCEHRSS